MKKVSLNMVINFFMFLYILSLYLLTYRSGLNMISNGLALILIALIWINFLVTRRKIIFNKFLLVHVLFIISCAISIFYSLNQGIAFTKVRTLVLICVLMISLANYIDTLEKMKKVIKYFVISGFVASIYIIFTSDFSQITRFGGDLGNVNAIGMIIGISATFCYYIMISEKKHLYLLFLIVMIITILLTGSRKSLAFIFLNIIFITYLSNRDSMRKKMKFIVVALLSTIALYYIIFNVPILYQTIGIRMGNTFDFIFKGGTNEKSMNTRASMISHGIEMFENKPLMGHGIDNYRVLLGRAISGEGTYAHNNYIELLVDIGLVGFFIYYLGHFIIIKDLLKCIKKHRKISICFPFLTIIILYLLLGISLVYYDSKHFSFLIVMSSCLPGLILNDRKMKESIK